jgi:hypothetical protein
LATMQELPDCSCGVQQGNLMADQPGCPIGVYTQLRLCLSSMENIYVFSKDPRTLDCE